MKQTIPLKVGVVAPSFKVPWIEFQLGIEQIREAGFEVEVHPQCKKSHWYFAGKDEERAGAFFEFACDPRFDILWYARGGYGASRILSFLDRYTQTKGLPPQKLLVGFSDATAIHEYVRARWGWYSLHASMPGLRKFCQQKPAEWRTLVELLKGKEMSHPFGVTQLKFQGTRPAHNIEGELTGGNLCVVTSLVGTPYAMNAHGKIVFFEEVDEGIYRIDRMVQQLLDSRSLQGARAIVLGNFLDCRDGVPQVLGVRPTERNKARMIRAPKPEELVPLRKKLNVDKAIREIFGRLGAEMGIPVAFGLPVGHGPGKSPLPLGGHYRLGRDGRLTLLSWQKGGPDLLV